MIYHKNKSCPCEIYYLLNNIRLSVNIKIFINKYYFMLKTIFKLFLVLIVFIYSSIQTHWLDRKECVSKYWYASIFNTETNNCSCRNDYVFWNDYQWNYKCVSQNQVCKNQYGIMWVYDNTNKACWCYTGYLLVDNQCQYSRSICMNKLWYWSDYNTEKSKCECREWFELSNWKCVSDNTMCTNDWWYWSYYNINTKSCSCREWYISKEWKCKYATTECIIEFWSNSYYNKNIKTCGCKQWFTMSEWMCKSTNTVGINKINEFKKNNELKITVTKNKLRNRLLKKFSKKDKNQLNVLKMKLDVIILNYINKNNIYNKKTAQNFVILISFSDLLIEYANIINNKKSEESKKISTINEVANNTKTTSWVNDNEITSKPVDKDVKISNSSISNKTLRTQADNYFKIQLYSKSITQYELLIKNQQTDLLLLNNLLIAYIYESRFQDANKILFILYNASEKKDTITWYAINEWNLSKNIYKKLLELKTATIENKTNLSLEYAELLYKAWDHYYYDNKEKNFFPIMYTYITAYLVLDNILETEPNNDKALYLQWRLLMDINGDFKLAQQKLEKTITLNNNNFNYYYRLWNSLMHQDKYEEAKVQFLKWIDLEKNYEKLYLNLGNMYFDLNEDEKWFSAYEKGIKICKTHCDWFYHNMGNQYYHNKENTKAIFWYEKVTKNHKNYVNLQKSIETLKKSN